VFQRHVVAQLRQPFMPKVFLESVNDVLYYSDHTTLRWVELEKKGAGKAGTVFTHHTEIMDFTVIPEEGTALASLANGQ